MSSPWVHKWARGSVMGSVLHLGPPQEEACEGGGCPSALYLRSWGGSSGGLVEKKASADGGLRPCPTCLWGVGGSLQVTGLDRATAVTPRCPASGRTEASHRGGGGSPGAQAPPARRPQAGGRPNGHSLSFRGLSGLQDGRVVHDGGLVLPPEGGRLEAGGTHAEGPHQPCQRRAQRGDLRGRR